MVSWFERVHGRSALIDRNLVCFCIMRSTSGVSHLARPITCMFLPTYLYSINSLLVWLLIDRLDQLMLPNALSYDPRHEKTCFLHICENKDADQLRAVDQRLCFRYMDTSEIRKFKPVTIFCGGCAARFVSDLISETPETGFLTTRLICKRYLDPRSMTKSAQYDKRNQMILASFSTRFDRLYISASEPSFPIKKYDIILYR